MVLKYVYLLLLSSDTLLLLLSPETLLLLLSLLLLLFLSSLKRMSVKLLQKVEKAETKVKAGLR